MPWLYLPTPTVLYLILDWPVLPIPSFNIPGCILLLCACTLLHTLLHVPSCTAYHSGALVAAHLPLLYVPERTPAHHTPASGCCLPHHLTPPPAPPYAACSCYTRLPSSPLACPPTTLRPSPAALPHIPTTCAPIYSIPTHYPPPLGRMLDVTP